MTAMQARIYRVVSGPARQGSFWVRWCKTAEAAQITADVMDKHAPPSEGLGAAIDAIDFESSTSGFIAMLNALGGNFDATLMAMEPGPPVSIACVARL